MLARQGLVVGLRQALAKAPGLGLQALHQGNPFRVVENLQRFKGGGRFRRSDGVGIDVHGGRFPQVFHEHLDPHHITSVDSQSLAQCGYQDIHLVGLEVVATLSPKPAHLLAAALLLVLVLGARLVSVAVPIGILHTWMKFDPGLIKILTWGGLKGGISVALALSLPPFPGRAAVVTATSIIVAFSVVIQGLTIGPLIHRQMERNRAAAQTAGSS